MKISRIIKTVFMEDFVAGFLIAIKKIFKSKKTINYPFEKGKISPRFRGERKYFTSVCFRVNSFFRRMVKSD